MNIGTDKFDEIVEDIKQKNLSRSNMPKLIIGTGLSVIYGVPGMNALAEELNQKLSASSSKPIKTAWGKYYADICKNGLEAGLANIASDDDFLVNEIKEITARYILDQEEVLHSDIFNQNTGFSKLLSYLDDTVSVNKKIIDVMTPNYDRIIEIICDKLNIGVITGFSGCVYGKFNKDLLKDPAQMYNCKSRAWVRLFKPHGSINWIYKDGSECLTNDYEILKNNTQFIEIVTPGSSKYKIGLTNNTFRCMREEFNELLDSDENYSLLIYGYGFNDDHFDTALFESFQKNVLILARDVKPEIIAKALSRKNITVFYREANTDMMIYKAEKYVIDYPIWDINAFAEIFMG